MDTTSSTDSSEHHTKPSNSVKTKSSKTRKRHSTLQRSRSQTSQVRKSNDNIPNRHYNTLSPKLTRIKETLVDWTSSRWNKINKRFKKSEDKANVEGLQSHTPLNQAPVESGSTCAKSDHQQEKCNLLPSNSNSVASEELKVLVNSKDSMNDLKATEQIYIPVVEEQRDINNGVPLNDFSIANEGEDLTVKKSNTISSEESLKDKININSCNENIEDNDKAEQVNDSTTQEMHSSFNETSTSKIETNSSYHTIKLLQDKLSAINTQLQTLNIKEYNDMEKEVQKCFEYLKILETNTNDIKYVMTSQDEHGELMKYSQDKVEEFQGETTKKSCYEKHHRVVKVYETTTTYQSGELGFEEAMKELIRDSSPQNDNYTNSNQDFMFNQYNSPTDNNLISPNIKAKAQSFEFSSSRDQESISKQDNAQNLVETLSKGVNIHSSVSSSSPNQTSISIQDHAPIVNNLENLLEGLSKEVNTQSSESSLSPNQEYISKQDIAPIVNHLERPNVVETPIKKVNIQSSEFSSSSNQESIPNNQDAHQDHAPTVNNLENLVEEVNTQSSPFFLSPNQECISNQDTALIVTDLESQGVVEALSKVNTQPSESSTSPDQESISNQDHAPNVSNLESPHKEVSVQSSEFLSSPDEEQLDKFANILKEINEIAQGVNDFNGIKDDANYCYLDEMLIRLTIKLDNTETFGKTKLRNVRKKLIREVHKNMKILAQKVEEEEESKVD